MPREWPVAARVIQLKGDMSYREFEQDIIAKTGKRIPFTNLRRLAAGEQQGSARVLQILSEYSGRPIPWFYTTDEPETPERVAEARAEYLTPTGDPLKDQLKANVLALLDADGESSASNIQTLASIVEMMVKDTAKPKKRGKS
jgi:hypothetical protein